MCDSSSSRDANAEIAILPDLGEESAELALDVQGVIMSGLKAKDTFAKNYFSALTVRTHETKLRRHATRDTTWHDSSLNAAPKAMEEGDFLLSLGRNGAVGALTLAVNGAAGAVARGAALVPGADPGAEISCGERGSFLRSFSSQLFVHTNKSRMDLGRFLPRLVVFANGSKTERIVQSVVLHVLGVPDAGLVIVRDGDFRAHDVQPQPVFVDTFKVRMVESLQGRVPDPGNPGAVIVHGGDFRRAQPPVHFDVGGFLGFCETAFRDDRHLGFCEAAFRDGRRSSTRGRQHLLGRNLRHPHVVRRATR